MNQLVSLRSGNAKNNDLEDRTASFGEKTIKFCRTLRKDFILTPLVSQLVRSATSVGANYMEARGASSRKDFRNKIFICKKEAQETKHWFRMLAADVEERKTELRELWQEAHELNLIFQKITTTLDKNDLKEKLNN